MEEEAETPTTKQGTNIWYKLQIRYNKKAYYTRNISSDYMNKANIKHLIINYRQKNMLTLDEKILATELWDA